MPLNEVVKPFDIEHRRIFGKREKVVWNNLFAVVVTEGRTPYIWDGMPSDCMPRGEAMFRLVGTLTSYVVVAPSHMNASEITARLAQMHLTPYQFIITEVLL